MNGKPQNSSKLLNKLCKILALFCLVTCLTSCVKYDAGINFVSQTQGEIIETLRFSDQLISSNPVEVKNWIKSVERRTRKLSGKSQVIANKEVRVTIPFNNGQELAEKFNQFFNDQEEKTAKSVDLIPKFDVKLDVQQNNWGLAIRNKLSLKIDLSSLSLISNKSNFAVVPGSKILDSKFRLTTPWGSKNYGKEPDLVRKTSMGERSTWTLKPGQINTIEVVFWVPSSIGIGSVFIIILVILGIYLQEKILPRFKMAKPKQA